MNKISTAAQIKSFTWRYANHNISITIEVSDGLDEAFAEFFAETLRRECSEALGRFRVGMSSITIVADDRAFPLVVSPVGNQ